MGRSVNDRVHGHLDGTFRTPSRILNDRAEDIMPSLGAVPVVAQASQGLTGTVYTTEIVPCGERVNRGSTTPFRLRSQPKNPTYKTKNVINTYICPVGTKRNY